MIAALNGHIQSIETLIGHRANVNAKNKVFCQLYIIKVLYKCLIL